MCIASSGFHEHVKHACVSWGGGSANSRPVPVGARPQHVSKEQSWLVLLLLGGEGFWGRQGEGGTGQGKDQNLEGAEMSAASANVTVLHPWVTWVSSILHLLNSECIAKETHCHQMQSV